MRLALVESGLTESIFITFVRAQYQLELSDAATAGQVKHTTLREDENTLDLTEALANGGRPLTLITGLDANWLKLPLNVTVMSSKKTYGLMMRSLMPVELLATALVAALMGNLASASNLIATLFATIFIGVSVLKRRSVA